MLELFQKWGEHLNQSLKNGDLRQISKATVIDYHKVRRLLDCTGKEEDMEKVFVAINALIRKRALEHLSATEAFTQELIEVKERIAAKAVKAVQQLKED